MTWNKTNHSPSYTQDKFLPIHVRGRRDKVPHGQNIVQQWVAWVKWTSLQVVLTGCSMYWAFSSLSGSLLFLLFSSQANGVPGNGSVMELCRELASLLFCLLTLLNHLSNIGPILAISYRSWIFAKIWQSSEGGEERSQKQQTTQLFGFAAWISHYYPTPASL